MDLLDDLTSIGFTEYEAKVYVALLREHPATGYQIGKSAGVPRSMVYEALGRLHVRGAVLKTEEPKVTLYRPVPPGVLIDRLAQEQQRLHERLRSGLLGLFAEHEEDRFWTISGRGPVISYAAQMIEDAEDELLLVVDDEELDALREDVEAACGRGVEVSTLLTGAATLGCGRVARHPRAESELQQLAGTLVVVADCREVLIASSEHDMAATITGNRNLVYIARQFVWMELFAQRIIARLGPALLGQLDAQDREILEEIAGTAE
jgi:Cd2+/Zn2+-exporting ATPase